MKGMNHIIRPDGSVNKKALDAPPRASFGEQRRVESHRVPQGMRRSLIALLALPSKESP
jgi:hypothetical protein